MPQEHPKNYFHGSGSWSYLLFLCYKIFLRNKSIIPLKFLIFLQIWRELNKHCKLMTRPFTIAFCSSFKHLSFYVCIHGNSNMGAIFFFHWSWQPVSWSFSKPEVLIAACKHFPAVTAKLLKCKAKEEVKVGGKVSNIQMKKKKKQRWKER